MSEEEKNIFVIGDVHGCYYTLMKLVKKLPKEAKLIFVGDLCDKGNFSMEVLDFVIKNRHLCVKGNHEYFMRQYIKKALLDNDMSSKWAIKKGWGGRNTIESYRENIDILEEHLAWIDALPLYLEIDNFFITHGFGLPYYKRKKDDKSHSLFVNRIDDTTFMKDWEDFKSYDVVNIFGHCNFNEVLRGKNYTCIDTGCCYGNKLSAINLKTFEIVEEKTDSRDIEKKVN